MSLSESILYVAWCTIAIITTINAAIRNPNTPWIILIVLYCNCFAYAMFEELVIFAQRLYGNRMIIFAMRNYRGKAVKLAAKILVIYIAILPVVQTNQ